MKGCCGYHRQLQRGQGEILEKRKQRQLLCQSGRARNERPPRYRPRVARYLRGDKRCTPGSRGKKEAVECRDVKNPAAIRITSREARETSGIRSPIIGRVNRISSANANTTFVGAFNPSKWGEVEAGDETK